MRTFERNTLFFGDNLSIMQTCLEAASVDLVYLDPPFNSRRDYNILFKDEHGLESDAQVHAFDDAWHWGKTAEETYQNLVASRNFSVGKMISSLRDFIGPSQMLAYLVMMTARLTELHRVLKPSGSLYLHCDPTASHYLKIILDTIFGPTNFRTEITWKRSSAHSDTRQGRRQHGRICDIVLFYTKSDHYIWNTQYTPYDQHYIDTFYRHIESETGRRYRLSDLTAAKGGGDTLYEWHGVRPYVGRAWAYSRENMEKFEREGRLVYSKTGMPSYKRFLDEMPGVPLQDLWDDIPPLGPQAAERLGYPTQKPLALLERIINTSSNPGDIVLDPFCGCGTAVAAAEKLGRRWLGIDITHLAISVMKSRLHEMFPGIAFQIHGDPKDLAAARQLAQNDRYQFQWWALSLVNARPLGEQPGSKQGKKGADRGIDGIIPFLDDVTGRPKRALVQVKSGHVRSGDVRDLRGTLEREQAPLGAFLTLEPPTRDMLAEAAAAGVYRSPGWRREYPRLQVLTIEQLLGGADVKMPPAYAPFKQAQRLDPSTDQHAFDW